MIWLFTFLCRLLSLLILLRVAASWLDPSHRHEGFRLLYVLTEPILAPFRRLFYLPGMRFDFSPLIALFCLEILRRLIVSVLMRLTI